MATEIDKEKSKMEGNSPPPIAETDSSNEQSSTHSNVLPVEILGQVFRELPVVSRLHAEGVNRRWRSTMRALGWTQQKKLDYDIIFEGPGCVEEDKFDNQFLMVLLRRIGGALRELDLHSITVSCDGFKFNDETLGALSAALASECPQLERLEMGHHHDKDVANYERNNRKVRVSTVNIFIEACPRLKSVRLKGDFIRCRARDGVTALTSLGKLSALEQLHIEGLASSAMAFDDAALTALATGCRWLKSLRLSGTIHLTVGALSSVVLEEGELFSSLRVLELNATSGAGLDPTEAASIVHQWKTKKYNFPEIAREVSAASKQICSFFIVGVPGKFADVVDHLIEDDFLPVFVNALSSEIVDLQFDAARALNAISLHGTNAQKWALVRADAVSKLFALLNASTNPSVRAGNQAFCAIENIFDAGSAFREYCLGSLGIVASLVETVVVWAERATVNDIFERVGFIFERLCGDWEEEKQSSLPAPTIRSILVGLEVMLGVNNEKEEEILEIALRTLVHIVREGKEARIQLVVDSGIVPRLVQLCEHPVGEVHRLALHMLGQIASGREHQAQALLDAGALGVMPALLAHQDADIIEEALWFLVNVSAGSERQIRALICTPGTLLIPLICHHAHRRPETRKSNGKRCSIAQLAVLTLANALEGANADHVFYFVRHGVIQLLCDSLDAPVKSVRFVEHVLCGLARLLDKAKSRVPEIGAKIVEYGGLDKIKRLEKHSLPKLSTVAGEILEKFDSSTPQWAWNHLPPSPKRSTVKLLKDSRDSFFASDFIPPDEDGDGDGEEELETTHN